MRLDFGRRSSRDRGLVPRHLRHFRQPLPCLSAGVHPARRDSPPQRLQLSGHDQAIRCPWDICGTALVAVVGWRESVQVGNLSRAYRVLAATLSAHGSAAVFVDETATLCVAEPQVSTRWGWMLRVSSDWRGKGPGLTRPGAAARPGLPWSGWPGAAAARGPWSVRHVHAGAHQRAAAHGIGEPPRPARRRTGPAGRCHVPRGADRGHRGVSRRRVRSLSRGPLPGWCVRW